MKKYIHVKIEETGRNNPGSDATLFGVETVKFETVEEIREFFIDRYGKIPNGKNKVYIDDENNNPVEVGFTHSFWNQDVSHMSPRWYQTDWITFKEVSEQYTAIKL